jgi:trehalose/maltose transport system substrate-binding protein
MFGRRTHPHHTSEPSVVFRLFGFTLLALLCSFPFSVTGVTLRYAGDSLGSEAGRWSQAVIEEWARKTNNTVLCIGRPTDTSATLELYQQYWAAKSADIDVYLIDVIWQGVAAPHAADLHKYVKANELEAYFPRIVENNTVDGKLVSLPLSTDAGMLYYRTDLLQKYGYQGPPKTWEQLAEMAKKIQDSERAAGNPDFQGFVFEGKASETVTCNALEWIYSFGGGRIVEPDKKITVNNPNAIKALDTARSWVGFISPPGVSAYGEEEARNLWQSGNAAFMRNWPYAYALGQDPKSAVAGKFAIEVLPTGGSVGKNAACLGGWNLMISAYSKAPDASAELIKYLSSPELQKERAIKFSQLPTRPALYTDPDVLAKNAWFKNMLDVLNNAVARPSTVTDADYNQLSTSFFQNANSVLTGGESAQKAVSEVEKVAKRIVR